LILLKKNVNVCEEKNDKKRRDYQIEREISLFALNIFYLHAFVI